MLCFHLGVLTASGAAWRKTRKYTVACMRDLGVGKKSLEEVIMDEILVVTSSIAKYEGKPFDPRSLLLNSVANSICTIVFGRR